VASATEPTWCRRSENTSICMRDEFEWPSYYPDVCPPGNAEPTNGEVYRLIDEGGPTDEDFVCHKLLYPHKNWKEKECQACGLSVHPSPEGCDRLKRRIPALRRKRTAVANLQPKHGLLLHTPSSADKAHHTWWVPASLQAPYTLFSAVIRQASRS